MKRGRIFLLMAFFAMMSVMVIGCGGDEDSDDDTGGVTTPPVTTTPDDGNDTPIPLDDGGDLDLAAEKQEILDLWAGFMKAYNDRKMNDVKTLWTNQASDFLFVNISDNERIDAEGSRSVQDTLTKLAKGHASTLNDKWNGGNMTEVYIRSKGGKLQAAAHGPNALRNGESWVYFEKAGSKWLINKVASIEARNLPKWNADNEIGEDNFPGQRGWFDDEDYRVP